MRIITRREKARQNPRYACIFPKNPTEAAELAESFISQGCKHLKTKLIGDINEDSARIKAIKKACPEIIHLQGDANEGYTTMEKAVDAVMRLGMRDLIF